MPTTPNSFSPLNLNVFFSGQATTDGALTPIGGDAVGASFANLLASLAPQGDQPVLPMLAANGKPLPQQTPLDDWSHVLGEHFSGATEAASVLTADASADTELDALINEQGEDDSIPYIGVADGTPSVVTPTTPAANDASLLAGGQAASTRTETLHNAADKPAVSNLNSASLATPLTTPSTAPLSDWLSEQQRMQTRVSQQAVAASMQGVREATGQTAGQNTGELASVSIAASFSESDFSESNFSEPEGEGLKRPMLNTAQGGDARSPSELGALLSGANGQPLSSTTPAATPELSALHNALVSAQAPANTSASEGFAVKTASELSVADALQMQQDQMTEANERLVFGRQPEQWGGALGARIVSMIQQDVQSAEIHLDPPELGSLEVRVKVHQGEASIQVATSHPQVRDVLESQAFRLREALAEDGMNLSQFDVGSQSQQGDGSSGEQSNSGEHSDQALAQGAFAEGDDVPSKTVLLKTEPGRLDTFA